MSKMSELAASLDMLTEVGGRLVACGEDLIRAATCVRECFSEDGAEARPPESAEAPEPVPENPGPQNVTKEELRALLAALARSGFRGDAKVLVRKYSDGGNLGDIPPSRYPALVAEARKYHSEIVKNIFMEEKK